MRGMKVKGHAHLVRSAAVPGLILSNNTEAGQAALRARQRQESQDQLVEIQAIQITQLQNQMKAILEHVGVPDTLKEAEIQEEESDERD